MTCYYNSLLSLLLLIIHIMLVIFTYHFHGTNGLMCAAVLLRYYTLTLIFF